MGIFFDSILSSNKKQLKQKRKGGVHGVDTQTSKDACGWTSGVFRDFLRGRQEVLLLV